MAGPKPEERGIGRWGRHVITLSHHASYWLSKKFPRRIGTMFVVGYPKSGTVWATQMVADYLQLPFADMSFFPIGFPSVMHGHYPIQADGPRAVYVVRDGRDTMVSMYFYLVREIRGSAPSDIPPRFRRYFPGMMDKEDIQANLPRFIEAQCRRPLGTRLNWADHAHSVAFSGRSDVPIMRYESMLQDCCGALSEAMEHLTGVPANSDRIEATVAKYSFATQSGRRQGAEDKSSFLRKGKAGDWRNHFTREAAEVFDQYCGEALIELGYEMDCSWVKTVGD